LTFLVVRLFRRRSSVTTVMPTNAKMPSRTFSSSPRQQQAPPPVPPTRAPPPPPPPRSLSGHQQQSTTPQQQTPATHPPPQQPISGPPPAPPRRNTPPSSSGAGSSGLQQVGGVQQINCDCRQVSSSSAAVSRVGERTNNSLSGEKMNDVPVMSGIKPTDALIKVTSFASC
jgi:hypothetical protein